MKSTRYLLISLIAFAALLGSACVHRVSVNELLPVKEPVQTEDLISRINAYSRIQTFSAQADVIVWNYFTGEGAQADAFPEAGLIPPAGHHKRGTWFRWLFYAAGPVEAAVTNRALKVEVSEEQSRFVGYGNFDAAIDALELALRPGPYICGDQFTAADLYVGSQLGYGMLFGSIDKRPLFEEYFDRLQARPGAVRARELDDALMAPAA